MKINPPFALFVLAAVFSPFSVQSQDAAATDSSGASADWESRCKSELKDVNLLDSNGRPRLTAKDCMWIKNYVENHAQKTSMFRRGQPLPEGEMKAVIQRACHIRKYNKADAFNEEGDAPIILDRLTEEELQKISNALRDTPGRALSDIENHDQEAYLFIKNKRIRIIKRICRLAKKVMPEDRAWMDANGGTLDPMCLPKASSDSLVIPRDADGSVQMNSCLQNSSGADGCQSCCTETFGDQYQAYCADRCGKQFP